MAEMGEMKEGYCSTHGYDWCKCLKAIDDAKTLMEIMLNNEKHPRKKTKANRPSAIGFKTPRVSRKKNLPDA